MTLMGWIQIFVFFLILIILIKPFGKYMAKVFHGERTLFSPVLNNIERFLYHISGIHPDDEMDWKEYAKSFLLFSGFGFLFLYIILRIQARLPLNPQSLGNLSPDLALNTVISFVTNTNWQNYGGETTLSYFSQMAGLTVQNFLSAASGMAILVAFIRGLSRSNTQKLGNFWVDITRSVLYILLPISIVIALILVSQGVVQTFASSINVELLQTTVEQNSQTIAVGPVASQIAIKMLGTNGGGFFNANSAHPFENPTIISNFIEMLAMILIPAASCYMFGIMVGNSRQGWTLFVVMSILLISLIALSYYAEASGNPLFSELGIDQSSNQNQSGGNMEGKEVRFGVVNSSLWATITTATSCGAVNSMHDSFSSLGGLAPLTMMMLGEVVFGGVGSGLYGMLAFVIVAVFIAGLMVGRTPEYLGKKIEVYEMKMASLLILIIPIIVLGLTAVAVSIPAGQSQVLNQGPHGFSEILYAFTSQGNNNGSAFAGLNGNTVFYNVAGSLAMLIGRFWLVIPTLALAGSLAIKKKVPTSAGTLSTTSGLFIFWLLGIIILVGLLNFIPALALGPIIEHLVMTGV